MRCSLCLLLRHRVAVKYVCHEFRTRPEKRLMERVKAVRHPSFDDDVSSTLWNSLFWGRVAVSRKSAAVSLNTYFFFFLPLHCGRLSLRYSFARQRKKNDFDSFFQVNNVSFCLLSLSRCPRHLYLFVCLLVFLFFFCVVNFHTEKTLLRKLVRGAALQTRKKKSGKKKKKRDCFSPVLRSICVSLCWSSLNVCQHLSFFFLSFSIKWGKSSTVSA